MNFSAACSHAGTIAARLIGVACVFLLASVCESASDQADRGEVLTVADYFRLKRFTDLRLSDDGRWLAFATESAAARFGNPERQTHVVATSDGRSQATAIPHDASQPSWVPGTHELAYLSKQGGVSQVYSYDLAHKRVKQITHAKRTVLSFSFRPGHAHLALVIAEDDGSGDLPDPLKTATTGILLDSDTTSAYDFILGARTGIWREHRGSLWLQDASGRLSKVSVPGNVKTVKWSRDGASMSVVYVRDGISSIMTQQTPTSIGVFDPDQPIFFDIAAGEDRRGSQEPVVYVGGEWSRDGRHVVVRRNVGDRPWLDLCFMDWAVVAISPQARSFGGTPDWHAAETCNPGATVQLSGESTLLVENTEHGIRSLYEWSPSGSKRARRLSMAEGSQADFAFGADLAQVAFVQQSMSVPPEIYFQDGEAAPIRKLTSLNEVVARKALPRVRTVEWKSTDGARVSGWLMEPIHPRKGKWPLITYLHGGPGAPVVEEFAQFVGVWPHVFEIYAAQGMAVFFPNYRGTASFGRAFMKPSAVDGEPVDDVLSGVRFLIDSGMIDRDKLGLCGHSHGAWLGSLILTKTRMFSASSFAEGWANMMVTYDLMPGLLNRDVHDVVLGGDPYAHAQRYIDLSPGLHFESVSTPVLFESGVRSGALLNLGFAKAAKRFGVASESIIYPNTDHVMSDQSLQVEAATRNLQWFLFWLNDRLPDDTAGDPSRRVRWQHMRTQSAASGPIR